MECIEKEYIVETVKSLTEFLEETNQLESVRNGACFVVVNGQLVRDVDAVLLHEGDNVLVVPKVVAG